MEIRIRTHEELRTDRVTIEITGTGAEVREMAKDGEVDQLRANEEYHLGQIGKLRGRIAELERTLAGAIDREAKLDEELTRRAGIVKRLENKVEAYDTDRHTERDRADQNKKWAETEAEKAEGLSSRIAELERTVRMVEIDRDQFKAKLMEGHVCTGGCSGNQHVAFVGRKALIELENQVAALTRRIDNARVLLVDSQVKVAQDKAVTKAAVTMAEAIGKVLDTLA